MTVLSVGTTTVPADTLVADDFDDYILNEIHDDTDYNDPELFPWLIADFGLSKFNNVQTLIENATMHLGLPYRRGGKTPRGFDCSGFTGYVFRSVGIRLGASSRDQFRQGEPVETDQLQPGDLVFFSGRAGGYDRVGHVGMVIDTDSDGTIRFIHSTHRSGITISRLDEPYYSSRYMGARRMDLNKRQP